jgi:hypothetical protein
MYVIDILVCGPYGNFENKIYVDVNVCFCLFECECRCLFFLV